MWSKTADCHINQFFFKYSTVQQRKILIINLDQNNTMKLRVVVLGAGFGGLELSTMLSEKIGDRLDLTLIDKSDSFFLGFPSLMYYLVIKLLRSRKNLLSKYSQSLG